MLIANIHAKKIDFFFNYVYNNMLVKPNVWGFGEVIRFLFLRLTPLSAYAKRSGCRSHSAGPTGSVTSSCMPEYQWYHCSQQHEEQNIVSLPANWWERVFLEKSAYLKWNQQWYASDFGEHQLHSWRKQILSPPCTRHGSYSDRMYTCCLANHKVVGV